MAITGPKSAKDDKRRAARGVRRRHRQALRVAQDFDEFLLPHRLQCPWNNTYSWCRDGRQSYMGLEGYHYNQYIEATLIPDSLWFGDEGYMAWPPRWYTRLLRK